MPACRCPATVMLCLCELQLLPPCTQEEMGRLRSEVAGKVQAHEEMLKRKTDDM